MKNLLTWLIVCASVAVGCAQEPTSPSAVQTWWMQPTDASELPADFVEGLYTDQLGSVVNVKAARVTVYWTDSHGNEHFVIQGREYFRTTDDTLFVLE